MRLVIGNKNYSSWSMRPWVLMRACGIAFTEEKLRFDFSPDSPFRRAVAAVSPAGKVPVLLLDDGFAVWDTLAIAETLADRFPQAGVWPGDANQRARARSVSAEMHSGFSALRSHYPMNIEASLPEVGARVWAEQAAVRADVARIEAIWADALAMSGGPFLFGEFGAADAFYAPVVMRLRSYGLPVGETTRAYMDRVVAHPAVAAWIADAVAEQDFIAEDEPYRQHR
ncbi:glutathione S-transferase family protein [Rubrivivax albus]|uniref:Glutathione S-transferase family protein n=1 Tax=Rubrivivax albus TaxID=2499835 RepID=A0A437JW17_9BURK|nr:glutathione S-transferase family protein [Rubrivivax albus]RVT51585.1 glutathione S-transferase family protein [Rubrivivax albus]